MIITKISPAVKTAGRYNIFVDDSYSFSLDETQLVSLGFKKGDEIDEDELARLKNESEFGKSYIRAVDLISRRLRSEKELRDYAWQKQWTHTTTDRVIERLRDRGYLNDERFAESFVRSRANTRNFSAKRMKVELQKKGIKPEIITTAMATSDEYDESAALNTLIMKKRNKYDDERKLIAYLARQGFSYDDIRRALYYDMM